MFAGTSRGIDFFIALRVSAPSFFTAVALGFLLAGVGNRSAIVAFVFDFCRTAFVFWNLLKMNCRNKFGSSPLMYYLCSIIESV